MSVSLYLGLPGDGKSMAGMRKVVDWLLNTDLFVVTNLPIEMGELQHYLRTVYGKEIDVLSRVTILGQEQVRKFWLVRGHGWRMVDLEDDQWQNNKYPSLQRVYRWKKDCAIKRSPLESMKQSEIDGLLRSGDIEEGDAGELRLGCLYIIDECQNFWPARSYQTTPKGLLFYLSQHRHAGDECVFITQKEAQVEKTIRNLVLEYWVYRNLSQRRRMGFRLPGVFGYSCFDQPPSTPGAQFVGCGTFKMDTKGLAQCYRTADGVGVGGPTMLADTKRKRSGIPWQFIIVALLGVVVLAYFIPGWLQAGVRAAITRGMGGVREGVSNKVSVGNAALPVTNHPALVDLKPSEPKVIVPVVEPAVKPILVEKRESSTNRIIGAFLGSEGWFIVLSDGRQLSPRQYYFADHEEKQLYRIQEKRGGDWIAW